ncbi:hypothetical protein BD410DRAFT_811406 [Rickenella mellea]|uniref:Uncharacterized protein n=1 Tax=Rickenella mellea TaxID=50990 RepID=A0A4R5XFS7_9AGAM|nr:hypothetical protein BD410DRAFT_811406 [Rickenella mellea]
MSTKRKSDTTAGAATKKARSSETIKKFQSARMTVEEVLADKSDFPVPDGEDEVRKTTVELVEYIKHLEGEVNAATAAAKPVQKTKEQIETAAERVRTAARSGIRKQMSWKPTCKEGRAKWAYDGVCPDPLVFASVMNIEGPPKFKTKKVPKDEFGELIGDLEVEVRYDTLVITGTDVNVRWNPETGEFKFSGTYGRLRGL